MKQDPQKALAALASDVVMKKLEAAASEAAALKVTISTPEEDAESLNVAVAFAIVAHAWCARWRTS